MSGISFSFSKKLTKTPLSASKIAEKVEEDEVKCDIVTAIDDKKIESATPAQEKTALVIPCLQNNNWRLNQAKKKHAARNGAVGKPAAAATECEPPADTTNETLDDIARRELLSEVARQNEEWEQRGNKASNLVIPVFMRNQPPEGFEQDDNFDVSARAENPTTEDYEKVPVEEFGLAMLRGMGWKEGEAVGGKMKAVVAPVEAVIRPKGLGLGAEAPKPKPPKVTVDKSGKQQVEDLELKRGCHVSMELGEFKGFYGTVESIDDDMIRACVRLAINSLAVMVPIAALRVVSKDEFGKESKVINKSSYEEYKRKDERKPEIKRESDADLQPMKHIKAEKQSDSKSWIAKHLRVRIVDKNYRNRKYYKEKVVVKEVSSDRRSCTCRTDDKIMLEDLAEDMLETVIPRDEGATVMIVRGEHKGSLARLMKRDSDKSIASVKLRDSKETVKLHYDYVCEYVG